MTSRDQSAAGASPGTPDRSVTRRGILATTAGLAVGIAGCSDLVGSGEEGSAGTETPGETETNGRRGTATEPETTTEGDEVTETRDGASDGEKADLDSDEETASEGGLHEHGTLYVEVDGDRLDFSDPKYYEEGSHPDARADETFHFHDDGHQYTWHMHGERLTLAEALESLPDIAYEYEDVHVVSIEGERYVDGEDGVSITFEERDERVAPQAYELQDQDVIWVRIETGGK